MTAPTASRPHRSLPGSGVRPAKADSGWLLLTVVVALLCFFGLMMVLSASSAEGLRSYGGAWVFFLRQVMWLAIGSAALVGAVVFDYRRWARFTVPLLAVAVGLLVLVVVPGVGATVGGSTRWLVLGPVQFQPSELAKLAVLLFAADVAARRAERVHDTGAVLKPILVTTACLSGLILVQPDMGTAMIVVLIAVSVIFVGGVPLSRIAALLGGLAVSAAVLGMGAGYRRRRIFSFLNPWEDSANTGYQVAQSLVALGSGHVAGVGLGASRAKYGFLPNAHTDFIFAITGEELGLVGTVGLIVLFVAFAVLGVRAALRAPDRFGTLLAAGITAWIVGQAAINIGAVTGSLPVTGVPLPFVSFGGSALVVSMFAVGILVNIARHGVPSGGRHDVERSGQR